MDVERIFDVQARSRKLGHHPAFDDDEYKELSAFSGEEVYQFPEPIGSQTVYHHDHEEPETLPRYIDKGIKYADFKMGGTDIPIAKAIAELGLLSDEEINVKGKEVAPLDLFLELVPPTPSLEEMEEMINSGIIKDVEVCDVVDVKGNKNGSEIRHVLYFFAPDIQRVQTEVPGANPDAYLTALPAATFAKLFLEDEIEKKGVFPPEALRKEARDVFLERLANKGIKVNEKIERH
ncbi:hypothetical protein AKJ50_01040 [candidate division MSBL1 archaeon SCGC-AAA382A13]|uniref:Saccharopine dehydrogenase-like C-terminal domain-containing protein n=1 Tax=candidate division MSBL1 archaeon SCGC-AAA382A13 TaxID=1698279 RepID=A0A133VG60_9EURY|nr:hypothetical protein AKJ50_01040 [candidate division MSBL1 archaeon SCGC-AAA382A13]